MSALKTGLYDVFGNAVEYYEGDETGMDLDAMEEVPVGVIVAMGDYIRPLED